MNTKLNFFLCIFFMTLGLSAFSQNPGNANITAVKLTKAAGEQYYKKINIKAFTIDKNFILRPAEGYKITWFSTEKKIAIHPVVMKLTSPQPSTPGFDTEKVPGGTMFCLCNEANDDCKISVKVLDGVLVFDCGGMCGCGSFIIYDVSDPILGYETGGNWFNF